MSIGKQIRFPKWNHSNCFSFVDLPQNCASTNSVEKVNVYSFMNWKSQGISSNWTAKEKNIKSYFIRLLDTFRPPSRPEKRREEKKKQ